DYRASSSGPTGKRSSKGSITQMHSELPFKERVQGTPSPGGGAGAKPPQGSERETHGKTQARSPAGAPGARGEDPRRERGSPPPRAGRPRRGARSREGAARAQGARARPRPRRQGRGQRARPARRQDGRNAQGPDAAWEREGRAARVQDRSQG